MSLSIESVEILLFIAAIVALLAQRLRVPYTVGLLLTGVVLAFTGMAPDMPLTKDLIYNSFLPPLIFEAAVFIRWRELRTDLRPILLLATMGVLLATALVTWGMHTLAGWEWPAAALFGALISATDPVSVIALFKETGVIGRLRLLVEAESLLNDGAAAVVFGLVLTLAIGNSFSPFALGGTLLFTVVGGIGCGLGVGGAAVGLAWRTDDHLIELTVTTVAAYGSFLLAEHFHASGVLATLVTGLMVGNYGQLGSFTERGREAGEAFWEYAAFVANSLVFLLIGIRMARQEMASVLLPLLIAIVLVAGSRAVSVYSLCAVFHRSPRRIPLRHQHILFWGGLRGALSLALALGLPDTTPGLTKIRSVTFGVVAFSVIVQGLTVPLLMRRLGLRGMAQSQDTDMELRGMAQSQDTDMELRGTTQSQDNDHELRGAAQSLDNAIKLRDTEQP